jgi:hypothetical protein
MPFPGFNADIGMIARSATTAGEQAAQLTEIDYLNMPERARLAMATTLKPLTLALNTLPEGEQVASYYMLANGLETMYPEAVRNVGVMPALLPEMGGMGKVQAQLSQMLPPAHQSAFVSQPIPQVLQSVNTASNQPALPAQAQPVEDYIPVTAETMPVTVAASSDYSTTSDIAHSLATNLKSMIAIGAPGSGKNFAVFKAVQYGKALMPNLMIWAINTKGSESEKYYWEPCDRVLDLQLASKSFLSADDLSIIKAKVDRFLSEFQTIPKGQPKLIILDEALALKESDPKWFQGIMAGFNRMCSMGRSEGVYGWVLSQSPNATDLGISGGTRSVYRRLLMVESSNLGTLASSSTFFNGSPDALTMAETGRVFYDSLTDSWGAVPIYSKDRPTNVAGTVRNASTGQSRTAHLERSLEAVPSGW